MRGFGLIGIVLALAILVVTLTQRQTALEGSAARPRASSDEAVGGTALGGRARQDLQQALDAAMRAPRSDPDAQ